MLERLRADRILDEAQIEALAVGAAIYGTGGGGNPHIGKLRAREALRQGHVMRIIPLETVPDDAVVVPLGGIGASLVSYERIRQGTEGLRALRALEQRSGMAADAIVCEEIGGQNAMEPLIVAAMAGLPVVDCDGMGRAFPEMQMTTFSIYGHRSTPSAMCDPHGNVVVFEHAVSEKWHECMARACVVAQGGASVLATAPMRGRFLKRFAIPGSYSRAIALGEAVAAARRAHADPVRAVCGVEDGVLAFTGKITDVERRIVGGFARGTVGLAGLDTHAGDVATVLIQNENLVFSRNGVVEVVVPDLIVILDIDTGAAITTEMLRYGQRVAIVALPCHPLLRSPAALEVVGPAGFGLEALAYSPIRISTAEGISP